MIGISKLYCGTVESSDPLRYGRNSKNLPSHLLQFSKDKKPVIAWNITRSCNLKCVHCYSHSNSSLPLTELTEKEELAIIDDLADFGIPVLLFSGGEPLLHPRIFKLISYARKKGIRAVLSTNGTLITAEVAKKLKTMGLSYVGISIDGLEEIHNKFRGVSDAFERTMKGIENCQKEGLKVGFRFTINKQNYKDINGVFDLVEEKNIPRICFYHLAYAGRGTGMIDDALNSEDTRSVVDLIMRKTKELHNAGKKTEVLTVNNHCDGIYLYLKLLEENPKQAEDVLSLLKMNGGNSSGIGIGCISWDGKVHPDQFWRHQILGNVKDKPFSEIWTNKSNELLSGLRMRKSHLNNKCKNCKWLDICNGNSRARAEAVTNDIWGIDSGCYLNDSELF